jgi:hypothetical protein
MNDSEFKELEAKALDHILFISREAYLDKKYKYRMVNL